MINNSRISIYSIVSGLFVFMSLCPFIFPVMSSDVQPYAFAISIALLSYFIFELIERKSVFILSMVLLTVLLYLSTGESSRSLKIAYGYISFSFVCLCSYLICRRNCQVVRQVVFGIIVLWFAVGFLQTFADRYLFGPFISNSRTTVERGVFGLASEPSFYGVQCFYFLFLCKLFERKKELLLISGVAIMAFFFAQSTLGVIFVVVYIGLFVIDLKNAKLLLASSLLLCIALLYILSLDDGSRLSFFVNEFFEADTANISDDESTSVRLNSITRSWYSASSNMFMPQGFSKRYGSLVGDFLMSWGFLCIPYLFFIIKCLGHSYTNKYLRILSYFLFFLLLNSNVQIANPSLAFVVGFQLSLLEKQDDEDDDEEDDGENEEGDDNENDNEDENEYEA